MIVYPSFRSSARNNERESSKTSISLATKCLHFYLINSVWNTKQHKQRTTYAVLCVTRLIDSRREGSPPPPPAIGGQRLFLLLITLFILPVNLSILPVTIFLINQSISSLPVSKEQRREKTYIWEEERGINRLDNTNLSARYTMGTDVLSIRTAQH